MQVPQDIPLGLLWPKFTYKYCIQKEIIKYRGKVLVNKKKIDIKILTIFKFDILIPRGLWGKLPWAVSPAWCGNPRSAWRLSCSRTGWPLHKREITLVFRFRKGGDFYVINLCKSGGKDFSRIYLQEQALAWLSVQQMFAITVSEYDQGLTMYRQSWKQCTDSPETDLGFSL